MKQKNRHNPLKDYTDFIYYLVAEFNLQMQQNSD